MRGSDVSVSKSFLLLQLLVSECVFLTASFHVSLGILCVSSDRKCSQEGRSGCEGLMFLFQNRCCYCCCNCFF